MLPVPRTFCLPPPLEISALNIGKIVDEWCRIHVESITTLINCIVYLSGGAAHALSEPRGIVCSLSLRANWDGNPATALRLLAFDLRHKDEAEPLRCQWASLMVCNRHAEKEGGAPKRAAVAGLIPLVFCVKDHARFTGNGSFPIFRSRLADDTTLNACTRFVLTRVAAYCRICITNGVVHGDGTNTGGEGRRSILNTGRYRRQGKKWRWVRYSPGESHDPELEQLCTQVTVDSGGMMGMRLVWAVYDQVIRG